MDINLLMEKTKYRIIESDCGDEDGYSFQINDDNYQDFVGRYLVGSDRPLDAYVLKLCSGGSLRLRSPITCKTDGGYCERCISLGKANKGDH